eukprot:Clim_evm16s152 gene=Clim_evmTU16s152
MPKQVKDLKEFILTTRRKDARELRITRTGDVWKFKVRCKRYLYTMKVNGQDKAKKFKMSLPPHLTKNAVFNGKGAEL